MPIESTPGERDRVVYCPRCRDHRPRREWRHVWRHVASGAEGGRPAQVLRHLPCNEIVYLMMV
jgi:hypothetical protein